MRKRKSVVIADVYLCRIIGIGKNKIIVRKALVEKQARKPVKKNG